MAFAFPANPFNNQLYIDDLGQRWTYNFAQLRWRKDMNVIPTNYDGAPYLVGSTHTMSATDHGKILLVDQSIGLTLFFPDDLPHKKCGQIWRLGEGTVDWDVESGLEDKTFATATQIARGGALAWMSINPTGTAAEIVFRGAME